MRSSLTILLLSIVSQIALCQTIHYEVIRKGGKKLGNMTIERIQSPNQVRYEINSKVTFKILFSFTIDYESTSEYKHGKLIKEDTHNMLNGSTKKKSTIWFDGEKYTLDLGGSRTTIQETINYSVATIYFEEPTDGKKVFSPQFGNYLTFSKIGDHQYEMESPDGENIYSYTNGICSKVKVSRDFATFYFVMTEESLLQVQSKKIVGGASVID